MLEMSFAHRASFFFSSSLSAQAPWAKVSTKVTQINDTARRVYFVIRYETPRHQDMPNPWGFYVPGSLAALTTMRDRRPPHQRPASLEYRYIYDARRRRLKHLPSSC